MTVASSTNKVTYNGNGSTSVFAYTFPILDQDEILVQTYNTTTGAVITLALTVNYTVSGVGAASGGNVTIISPATNAPSGVKVVLTRNMTKTQETNYNEYDTFPAISHEEALDRLTMMVQELSEKVDRCVKFPVGNSTLSGDVSGIPTAGQVATINPSGTNVQFADPSSTASIGSYIFPAGTGFLYQSSTGNAVIGVFAGTTNEITISGTTTKTFSLPSSLTFTGKTITGGTFSGSTISNPTMSGTWQGSPSFSGTPTFASLAWTGALTCSGGTISGTVGGAHAYSGIITFNTSINEAVGNDIASATTTDIGAATGNFVRVTGTTTITGLGSTGQAGTRRKVLFTGILTLTHSSTLQLPTAANITTAVGDIAEFIKYNSSTTWICTAYTRLDGTALTSTSGTAASQAEQETGTATNVYVSPGRQQYHASAVKAWCQITYSGGTPSATSSYNVSSITDSATGRATVNFTVAMSSTNYACSGCRVDTATLAYIHAITAKATGSVEVRTYNDSGTLTDLNSDVSCFGDQ